MIDFVGAIQYYAVWLYFLLTVLVCRQLYIIWRAAQEHGTSLFGLEREAATGKAIRSMVSLLLYATIGLGVYTVGSATEGPRGDRGAAPPIIQTPPTAVLETDTPQPPASSPTPPPVRIITSTPEV